ncbi:9592_t:CDS:2, partial [Scutellospora calospora]
EAEGKFLELQKQVGEELIKLAQNAQGFRRNEQNELELFEPDETPQPDLGRLRELRNDLKKQKKSSQTTFAYGIPTPPYTPPLKPKQELNILDEFAQDQLPAHEIAQLQKTIQELQQKNQTLIKTIQGLKNPTQFPKENQETPSTFTCSTCTRILNIELIRLAKKSGKKICRNCTLLMLKRANQLSGKHIVLKIKKKPEQPTQSNFT